jgi:hypothetical protein
MGKMQREKGARVEREIVNRHRALMIKAERVPLSGGTGYQGNGEDIDITLEGDPDTLHCQVKALGDGRGTKGIQTALGVADALFLRFDAPPGKRAPPPLVVLPWATWERLLLR